DGATPQIRKRAGEREDEFTKQGLPIVQVERASFVEAVLKNTPRESMGFSRADYDKLQAARRAATDAGQWPPRKGPLAGS
ncbi:MAG: hypothetical protein ACKOBA_04140, partial [Limnohabitans sp.]